MAKIQEEIIVVKISKLIKADSENSSLITEEIISSIEQVAQELLGNSVIVEAELA